MTIASLILLCTGCFFAALVDAIAGGGGLISLPTFLMTGIPPHIALGTNKFSSSMGTLVSSANFIKSKKADMNLLKYILPFVFLGALLGVYSVLLIDANVLTPFVGILILVVGVYTMFSKNMGMIDKFEGLNRKNIFYGIVLGFTLGFYDGFFGPGTGSFLIFGLIHIYGFGMDKANGNAKIMNFTSNIASLLAFGIGGKIDYRMGLIGAVFMMLGAFVGSKLAIKKGSKLIKPVFISISLIIAVKMSIKALGI